MTLSDLHKWRFLVPVLLFEACAVPVSFMASRRGLYVEPTVLTAHVFALLAGFFYKVLEVRNLVWVREMERSVGPKIRTEISAMLPDELETTLEERKHVEECSYKQISGPFWEAIDRDSQLSGLKGHFYANGLQYTTAIDIALILGAASPVYAYLGWSWRAPAGFGAAACAVLVALGSWYLAVPSRRERHLALMDEQLDQMKRQQRDFLRSEVTRLVGEHRKTTL